MKYKNKLVSCRKLQTTALITLFIFALIGCTDQPTEVEDYQLEPILTAFLYSGEPVAEVTLERVASIYDYYNPADHGISDADIILLQLDGPGAGDTLRFAESGHPDSAGVYYPLNADTVKGMVHYRIEARKPGESLYLWAETVIPDTFSLETNYPLSGDSLTTTLTRQDSNLVLSWTPSEPIAGYIVNITCLDDSFTPLDPDFDPEEDEIPDDSSRYAAEVILEGYQSATLPWIFFNYVGWHRVELQAVDQPYWEYFFSVWNLAMGSVTSFEYNVHGGLGIFAGLARHSFMVYMEKVE